MSKTFRKNVIAIAIVLVAVAFLALNPILGEKAQNIPSCQNTVAAFSSLVHKQSPPDYLLKADPIKNGTEFDVNDFFSLLTHVSMENGYVLDYVYFFGGLGGEPIIYARKIDQAPFKTYSDYVESLNSSVSLTPWDVEYIYLDHIQVDGSAEGYFELVLLRLMGRQFYQYWHAFYNDSTIVCDHSPIDSVMSANADKISFTQKILVPLWKAEPSVEFKGNIVIVHVTLFSEGGAQFIQASYTINKSFPHTIQKESFGWQIIYGNPVVY